MKVQQLVQVGKTEVLCARLPVDELEEINRLATLLGTDRSKLTRWLIRRGMQMFIAQQKARADGS